MATNDNTTGNFTVLVGNDGKLTGPFTTDETLDFISKNNLATDAEVSAAKTEAISSAKTETEKQVSAAKTVLTTEINKKVNTSDYNSKVSSIELSIGSIETTINTLNNTYATDAEVAATKTELTRAIATAKTAAIDEAKAYTNTKIGNIVQFNISVVEELPTTNIQPNTIYLVPATNTENNNVSDEYLYVKDEDTGKWEWEQIGTTAIDLEPINTKLEKLENMMPEVIPDLIPPSITMTSNKVSKVSLHRVGDSVDLGTITTIFNSGKIDPQGLSDSSYRCGKIKSIIYNGPDWDHLKETVPTKIAQSYSFTNTLSKNYTVSNTATTLWNVIVSYNAGVQPKTNKGNDHGSPLEGGSISATISITGTYPFYATTSSIKTPSEQSLVRLNDTTSIKTAMVGCTDDNFWILEVPACWTITNVTGAASGQLGGNATNAVAQWTQTKIIKEIHSNNIKYYKYAYGANNAPKKGADTLTFSISYDDDETLVLAEGETWTGEVK